MLGLSLVSERTSRAAQTAATLSAAEADLLAEQARHGVETLRALGMTPRTTARWQKARGEALTAMVRASYLGGGFGAGLRTIRLFLQSGQPVAAFLHTESRTPASFLLKPATDYWAYAMRER